jgi:hypothetical protein
VRRGVDLPNAIDDAVARANRLALAQILWQQGCDSVKTPADPASCRQALLTAVRERRRTREPPSEATMKLLAPLLAAWKSRWPRGLPEPDPNIPNRDPFFGRAQGFDLALAPPWGAEEIPPALDPMTPREAVGTWRPDSAGVQLLLHTLGGFLSEADWLALERALGSGAESRWTRAAGAVAAATRAGRTDALGSAPFRRTAVLRALGVELQAPLAPSCCDAPAPSFEPPRFESQPVAVSPPRPPALAAFYTHCATCHAAPVESPPGFLYGSPEAVERQLARCAPRIAFRLAMWGRAASDRPKVPMPPPAFVPGWEQAAPRADIAAMIDHVRRARAAQRAGRASERAYEHLPPCRGFTPGAAVGQAPTRSATQPIEGK